MKHLLVVAALSLAGIADANALILCVDSGGNLSAVATCKKGWTPLEPAAAGLQGPAGPQGPVGPAGPKGDPCLSSDPKCVGPKGDRGPSDLYGIDAVFSPNIVNEVTTDIVSIDVPAGGYLIVGRVNIENIDTDRRYSTCRLSVPDFSLDNAGAQDQKYLQSFQGATFSVQHLAVFSSATRITMQCSSYNARVFNPRLAAIQVGAVHRQLP